MKLVDIQSMPFPQEENTTARGDQKMTAISSNQWVMGELLFRLYFGKWSEVLMKHGKLGELY